MPTPPVPCAASSRRFAERRTAGRGLDAALLGPHSAGAPFSAERRAHQLALEGLVARACAAGALRPGVGIGDVHLGLHAIASARGLPAASAGPAALRLADLVIAGLAAPAPRSAPRPVSRPAPPPVARPVS